MRQRHEVGFASAVGAVSVLLAFGILGRPLAQWRFPLNYDLDALNVLTIVQSGMERMWASGSDRLGAPGALDLAYYPMPEVGQLLLLKIISACVATPAVAVNLYFFLTFFLSAASGAYVLRFLGLMRGPAALGALTFSLLPCHFWRGELHLFVNGYYWVPVLCFLLLQEAAPRGETWRSLCLVAVACFIAPLVNLYYSCFFAFVMVLMSVFEAVGRRTAQPFARLAAAIAGLLLGFTLGWIRTLPLYFSHSLGFTRGANESEFYGLKLTQMILPGFDTVSSYVDRVTNGYRQTAPLVTENKWNDLGLIAACAFLLMLTLTFALAQWRRDSRDADDKLILRAGLCALVCFLYGTIGGFSSLISYLVSPFIRSGNRIEVFIAFFALLAALLWLQKFAGKWPVYALLCCVLFWDLSHKFLKADTQYSDDIYTRDSIYFAGLEKSLSPKTRIFQLPQLGYPENGPAAVDYEQFRPYLHTQGLVWSFGAVHGTAAERANRAAAAAFAAGHVDVFLAYLRDNHFAGVLLHRGVARILDVGLESALSGVLHRVNSVTPDETFVYYALEP